MVFVPRSGEFFIFSIADGTVTVSGRDQVFRQSTSIRDYLARGEEHEDDLQGESDGVSTIGKIADDKGPQRFLVDRRELHLSSSL